MSTHPADEYVEAFINNADKSKVLSVQNVMIVPKALVRLEEDVYKRQGEWSTRLT